MNHMNNKVIRLFTVILLTALLLTLAGCGKTNHGKKSRDDNAGYSEGLAYEINSDKKTCSIISIGSCTDTHVNIPPVIDGYTVTCIGWANYSKYSIPSGLDNCKSITSVTIPDSVTTLYHGAFAHCENLTDVTIPDSVTTIGSRAFWDCKSLTSIKLPDGITKIEDSTFENCESLKRVVIPDGVTSIGDSAFLSCDSLTDVEIPEGVTSIGETAFAVCTSLKSINIPSSVTTICGNPFTWANLTTFTVSQNNAKYHSSGNCLIETATKTLVAGCPASIIPDDGSVTAIGESAFYECTNLRSITIPDSVTTIGKEAFNGCNGLSHIRVPNSVTNIDEYAFAHCKNLTSVYIPRTVTHIGYRAFFWSENLSIVNYAGTQEDWRNMDRSAEVFAETKAVIYYEQ